MARLAFRTCLLAGLGFTLGGCGESPAPVEPPMVVGGSGNAGTSASLAGSAPASGSDAGGAAGSGTVLPGGGAGAGGAAGNTPVGGESGLMGVFVAQGHEGRITRSCDDGLTFPYNHSEDDAFRCFVDADHDCDHSEFAGRGLAFGAGSFVATWGWGHPGKLQRSVDGKEFSDVMTETPTFADVAFGNSLFVACGNPTRVSSDGVTWQMGGKLSFDFNYRGIEFVPAGGGTFIVTGESGEQRAISYSHDGKTWLPAQIAPTCGTQLRGIAGSDSTIIVVSALGGICRSSDGGESFELIDVAERFTSPPVWTGSEFWIYSGSQLYKSPDGETGTWQSQAITPNNIQIGNLARSPSGTILAANDGWQVWYEKQRLYRSTDGVSFTVLEPDASFLGSHPINFVSFGYVPASSGCGLP